MNGRIAIKRSRTIKQLVQHYSQCEDVAGGSNLTAIALRLFGCHVKWRTHQQTRVCLGKPLFDDTRDAKIGKHGPKGERRTVRWSLAVAALLLSVRHRRQNDVGGLDVQMDNLLTVAIGNGPGNRPDQRG